MPAHEDEAADAEAEGIRINWLRTISSMGEGGLTVEIQELDEKGKPHGTGRFEKLEADTVILALGQESDTGFLQGLAGVQFDGDVVQVDRTTLMTGAPGVFAGGDAVPSERTVTVGVGHGKKAARSIDAYLRGETFASGPKHPLASFEKLNLWYFGDHDRRQQPEREAATRVQDFGEVVAGLSTDEAHFEAGRCLSCGNCIECDGCFGACPEDAIIRLGKGNGTDRYEYNYDSCTGCTACYRQCPVHAIEMVAESEFAESEFPAPGAISRAPQGASSRGAAVIPVPEV
jgi:NADPH-dependent glutamate synthase beta subunit-like oxidoreductase